MITQPNIHHALYVLEMTKANLQYVVQNAIPAEAGEDEAMYPASQSEIELLSEAHDTLVRFGVFMKARKP